MVERLKADCLRLNFYKLLTYINSLRHNRRNQEQKVKPMTATNEEILTQTELKYDEVYALRRVSDGLYLSSKLDGFRPLMIGDTIYMGNIDTRTRPSCWCEWDKETYPFIFDQATEVVTLQVVKTVSIKTFSKFIFPVSF